MIKKKVNQYPFEKGSTNKIIKAASFTNVEGSIWNAYFFTVNLKSTQNAFKKLPWIRDVSVRRKWPDKLLITIEEHNVLARWGNLGLVNNYGEIFNAAFQDDLPVFNGDEKFVMDITKKYYKINKLVN